MLRCRARPGHSFLHTTFYFFVIATVQPLATMKKVQYRPLNVSVNKERKTDSLRHIGPRRGLFIDPHIKRSVLYLLQCRWRLSGCYDEKFARRLCPRLCRADAPMPACRHPIAVRTADKRDPGQARRSQVRSNLSSLVDGCTMYSTAVVCSPFP